MSRAERKAALSTTERRAVFKELLRGVFVYKWLVLLVFVASAGIGVAIMGRAPLVVPIIDKIFPKDQYGDREASSLIVDRIIERDGEVIEVKPVDASSPIPDKVKALFRDDYEIVDNRMHFLLLVSIIGVSLAMIGAASMYVCLCVGRYVQLRALNDIRVRVYRHLIGLSLKFYHRQKGGDLLSRLTNDLLLTQRVLNFIMVEMIMHPMRILVGLAIAIGISWQMTLLVMVIMPILVWPLVYLGKRVFRAAKKRQVEQADLTQAMLQTFAGIRVIQAFRMEDAETGRFEQVNDRVLTRAMKVERAKATARALVALIYSGGIPLMILGGGWLILEGIISVGRFVALLFVVAAMYPSIKSLSKVFNQLLECMAGANRVFELFDEKAEVVDRPDATDIPAIRGKITFDGVTFAYDDEPVLENVNFEVEAGKMIAVVGPSGAGKSTLLDLIARFYDPVKGSVLIDGHDIREFKRDSILENLAVVTQESFLFNTTILENIRFARPDATREQIEEAARAAQIHDFIVEKLPDGYDTVVGERGALLSGGQRQRITIARAILRNPPLLLLDEATSSLDTESENLVQKALRSLLKGRTTFVIAHRLSTVQDADHILVLEKGKLVEEGTHQALLDQKGVYEHLYRIQFSEPESRV